MFASTHFTYPQRDEELSQPSARLSQSGYWTQDLLHDGPLFYQLSYPSWDFRDNLKYL